MSDLALQLIAENKRSRAYFLDLGNCGLTEVPAEVGELAWLEFLSLANGWVEWDGLEWRQTKSQNTGFENGRLINLGPLGRLSGLRTLVLGEAANLSSLVRLNQLQTLCITGARGCDLTPLAHLSELRELFVPSVNDLAPLANLKLLRALYIAGAQVTDLAPVGRLSALRSLDLSGAWVSDLGPLAGLSALETLNAWGTGVCDLAPLSGLSALQTLNVFGTQIRDLTPLADLTDLRMLNVSHTQVADLSPVLSHIERGCPVYWSSESSKGSGIYVKDCPLVTPPPEIANQGNDAILNYFHERQLGEIDHLYEAKMLIVGEGGAGKTSLLRRLYQPEQSLPTEEETTKGISIHRHEFKLNNGRRFRLNVWDFGGQEIYHATHQFFLTRRSLYVLVDDTRKDYKSVSDEGFKYWLELIDVFGGHSPVLIFQNEKANRSKAIDIGGIKGRYDNTKELYAGNLERIDAADRLRSGIEFFASSLSHIGEELPARWIQVRADIEARASEVPYISQDEYLKIYGRHMNLDRSKALHLSRYLHDLGVFLHFQDDSLLARTVILQNQWATEAVFRILDDETIKKQLGRFNGADCERLWRDSVYAYMHPELLALMKRFELCYELRDSEPPTWLAPQLLPPAKPRQVVSWGKPEDLVLRFRYDFLPKGMISRLTVRLHRFVSSPEMAWVTGVLFEREATAVLVELLPNGTEIELRARGPERKELLIVIAADLDALNESFQGLRGKVDKRIPCNCRICSTVSIPHFFAHRALLRRKEDNRLRVECPTSYEDVNVLELLDGVRVDQLPMWAKEEPVENAARPIRIYLASSSELREDRDAFELYFRQRNDQLHKRGLYLEIVRWENFRDAVSETRLQDEYNKAIRACDIFVSLFFTKTGEFTDEEFEVAHRQFKNTGKPHIYTYFKKGAINVGSARRDDLVSLWAFKDKLRALQHFPTDYDNIEHLKLHFSNQLQKLLAHD